MSDYLLRKLANLRVDRGPGDPAPHKPLFLLVLTQMAEEAQLQSDVVRMTPELVFRFHSLWPVVAERPRRHRDIRRPFHHLSGDGLVENLNRNFDRSTNFADTVAIRLNADLYRCLHERDWRLKARQILISKYFYSQERVLLCELLDFPVELLSDSSLNDLAESLETTRETGRCFRFRYSVITTYNFTCAITGYRLITLNAETLVDAAHIVPVVAGGSNTIRNGIALSKNAHWAFDRGLLGIRDDYTVSVNEDKFYEAGVGSSVHFSFKGLVGTHLHLPRNEAHWPSRDNLAWHFEKVFLES